METHYPEYYALQADELAIKKDVKVNNTVSLTKKITEEDLQTIITLSGDNNPIHVDVKFAERTMFKGRIVHGIAALALVSAALTRLLGPGNVWLGQNFVFKTPIRINDVLTVHLRILEISKTKVSTIETRCINQREEIILEGTGTSRVFRIKPLRP